MAVFMDVGRDDLATPLVTDVGPVEEQLVDSPLVAHLFVQTLIGVGE